MYSPYSRVKRERLSVLEGLMVFGVSECVILCVCVYVETSNCNIPVRRQNC